jgi:hypothetical protein
MEGDHLENAGVDGWIIFQWTFEKWYGGMYWLDLSPDRNRRRAVLKAVMNLLVS